MVVKPTGCGSSMADGAELAGVTTSRFRCLARASPAGRRAWVRGDVGARRLVPVSFSQRAGSASPVPAHFPRSLSSPSHPSRPFSRRHRRPRSRPRIPFLASNAAAGRSQRGQHPRRPGFGHRPRPGVGSPLTSPPSPAQSHLHQDSLGSHAPAAADVDESCQPPPRNP